MLDLQGDISRDLVASHPVPAAAAMPWLVVSNVSQTGLLKSVNELKDQHCVDSIDC